MGNVSVPITGRGADTARGLTAQHTARAGASHRWRYGPLTSLPEGGRHRLLGTDEHAARQAGEDGAKIVRHARSVVFQMAEVAVPRALFQEILSAIAALPPVATDPMLRITVSAGNLLVGCPKSGAVDRKTRHLHHRCPQQRGSRISTAEILLERLKRGLRSATRAKSTTIRGIRQWHIDRTSQGQGREEYE
jgi:hypothetical protein